MKRTQLSADELKALRAVPVSATAPNRLRVAMAMLDLTQTDVARGADRTQASISDIYNFVATDVKLSTLRALADFFGCSIDDLFPRIAPAAVDDGQAALPFRGRKAVNA